MTNRSTCIRHPEKERLYLAREWQVLACGGDHCAAVLLSFFISNHDWKLESREQSQGFNQVVIAHGDEASQYQGLLQWHSCEEIKEAFFGLYGLNSIRKAIANLVALGFISIHRNPNPKYKFDKTNHFLLHPEIINNWIEAIQTRSVKNNDSCVKKGERCIKKGERSVILGRAIPKYSSKITSKKNNQEAAEEKSDFEISEDREFDRDPQKPNYSPPPTSPVVLPPDPMGDRFKEGKDQRSKYYPPNLKGSGFEDWHLGTGYNDWDDALLKVCLHHLQGIDSSKTGEEAKNYLNNLCRGCNWQAFQIRVEAAIVLKDKPKPRPPQPKEEPIVRGELSQEVKDRMEKIKEQKHEPT